MFGNAQSSAREPLASRRAGERETRDDQDENASKRAITKGLLDGKGLAALARRNVLGDRSNVVVPNLVPSGARNLRSSTLQASVAARSKVGVAVGVECSTTASIVERTAMGGGGGGGEDKENVAPRTNGPFPLAKGSTNATNTFAATTTAAAAILSRDWDDLDAEDSEDPLMVSEYVVEIFHYMRSLEPAILPSAEYMETQKELNWHSRAVLIDWLIEVQWKLKLLPETLFLSVNIIDRFLSKRSVSLVKLQLVGMAATLLASKYEEVLSPSIANFVYLADNAYDEQELLKAERYMLHVLNFSLAYPSPLVFLRRISKAEDYDVRSRTLAKYLMEVCMLDHRFVACPPSMTAAVAIYLARQMLKSGPWTPNLRHYSGEYTETDIAPWAEMLLDYLKKPIAYESVFKKYALKKMMKASLFVQEYMKRVYDVTPHTLRDNGKSVFTA